MLYRYSYRCYMVNLTKLRCYRVVLPVNEIYIVDYTAAYYQHLLEDRFHANWFNQRHENGVSCQGKCLIKVSISVWTSRTSGYCINLVPDLRGFIGFPRSFILKLYKTKIRIAFLCRMFAVSIIQNVDIVTMARINTIN